MVNDQDCVGDLVFGMPFGMLKAGNDFAPVTEGRGKAPATATRGKQQHVSAIESRSQRGKVLVGTGKVYFSLKTLGY
jgi:hypothetical protein